MPFESRQPRASARGPPAAAPALTPHGQARAGGSLNAGTSSYSGDIRIISPVAFVPACVCVCCVGFFFFLSYFFAPNLLPAAPGQPVARALLIHRVSRTGRPPEPEAEPGSASRATRLPCFQRFQVTDSSGRRCFTPTGPARRGLLLKTRRPSAKCQRVNRKLRSELHREAPATQER